jgi:hypothetical protein
MVPTGNNTQKHMVTKHILKTDFGVTAELELNEEAGHFDCQWDGTPPLGMWPKKFLKKVLRVYLPWRDQILGDWARRTGKKVLVVNC